ncbi:hypothetical protein PYS58_18110 [Chryseobacterium indologenes]|nr:hypothetical protein [Chryseobacterium indologenes]MDM1557162.1 hypothetical protein [Chryseobacterium indologenes]WET48478.1 hypothetical protein PYS58_18110 [Chryseobacterium indologenes]
MKKMTLSKLSRTELKDVFGGYLHPAQCPGGCHGEAMIRCPDGSTTMTNYICMGGRCEVAAICKPLVIEPFPDPIIITP